MKNFNIVMIFALLLGVYTPNRPSIFTGNPTGTLTGGGTGNTNVSGGTANNSVVTTTPFPMHLESFNLTNSATNFDYGLVTPQYIRVLATAQGSIFAALGNPTGGTNDEATVLSWANGVAGATAFTPDAVGTIVRLVAGSNLVAALNSGLPMQADVWTSNGSQYFSHSLCENIADVAVNGNDVFFATDRHFQHYFDAQGTEYVGTYPVVAGRVNALAIGKDSFFVVTVNDVTNNLDAWDNQGGTRLSSISTNGPVTRLATVDNYVFAVSLNQSNIIQVFDFSNPQDPIALASITAEGPIRQLVVACEGPSVFATNTYNLHHLQGWVINEDCEPVNPISGFNPLTFDMNIKQIAADQSRVTVYGFSMDQDHMKSYRVSDGCSEGWFYIPRQRVIQLGSTDCGDQYAVFADAPSKIQKFSRCGGHAVAFPQSACGDIFKLVVSDNLVVAITDCHMDIFSAVDGCRLGCIPVGGAINDVVINDDGCGGSIYLAYETYVIKFDRYGNVNWRYLGRPYEEITKLATSANASAVYAVTVDDSIIALDNCHGNRLGRFNASAPISFISVTDNAKVCFVYASCPSIVRIMDFCVPCCPTFFGSIDVGGPVSVMMATSSGCDKLFAVSCSNNNELYGWDISHLNCDDSFNPLPGFNPLTLCDGPIEFVVSSTWSGFSLYKPGFLASYLYAGNGAVNVKFNLHNQITHLASTQNDRVYATMLSDQNRIYAWGSCGGAYHTFCQPAAGPVIQLLATGEYVATLNDCANVVDVWRYDDCKLGCVQSCVPINDIALNNLRPIEETNCECTGSLFVAICDHFDLYDTCGNFMVRMPQLQGNATHIASFDGSDYVFVTNDANNNIEAYTVDGVFTSLVAASGPVTQLISKNYFVFETNSTLPTNIEMFDFVSPSAPFALDSIVAEGPIVQIGASNDGSEVYATNSTDISDIQGWAVGIGCTPTTQLPTYNPLTLTALVNLLAVDTTVVAVFGNTVTLT